MNCFSESTTLTNPLVSDPVVDTCNSTPSDHFVTLPDGCFEDGTNKNKVNIGKCNSHPCLRADTPFLKACDEAERCCQAGTVSETTVRCGRGEFKMKRVLNCRCDVCREKNTIVKGAVYVTITLPFLNSKPKIRIVNSLSIKHGTRNPPITAFCTEILAHD